MFMKIHMEVQYVHLMEKHTQKKKKCCYRAKVWKEVKEKFYICSVVCTRYMVNNKIIIIKK